tara:strand:+ start:878 stop:1228 length:351 start_codon:yes stop_codon:yes gene_type:complete
MKEIKFKAHNNVTGEVVIATDLYWFEENYVHESGDSGWDLYLYTGIERGGREVYKGDIFYIAGTGNCVVGIDPYFGVMFTDSEGEESSWIDEIAENDIGDYLGNKYENPELLGDTE